MTIEASVTAYGEKVIDIRLKRHKRGIRVSVKVAQEVEEFFRRWGGDVAVGLTHGRLWKSLYDENKLTVWNFEHARLNDQTYSLTHTGSAFFTENGLVNLSFLRLIGAGDVGASFICESVVGRSELERIAQKLTRASEQFYAEYIQPVHIGIFVGVQDYTKVPE